MAVSVRAFRSPPYRRHRVTTPRLVVPAISQLTAPRALRHRICSPTCVAMALALSRRDASLARVVRECLHEPSRICSACGRWRSEPRRCRADRRRRVFLPASTPQRPILERGLPIVASIRFAAGALPGAALSATDGHLVVVTGMDADWVYINDPAARDASGVPRQCPRDAFAAAWLTERGVGYVLRPLCVPFSDAACEGASRQSTTEPRVFVRPVARGDRDEFLALMQASRSLHEPWISPPLTRAHSTRTSRG